MIIEWNEWLSFMVERQLKLRNELVVYFHKMPMTPIVPIWGHSENEFVSFSVQLPPCGLAGMIRESCVASWSIFSFLKWDDASAAMSRAHCPVRVTCRRMSSLLNWLDMSRGFDPPSARSLPRMTIGAYFPIIWPAEWIHLFGVSVSGSVRSICLVRSSNGSVTVPSSWKNVYYSFNWKMANNNRIFVIELFCLYICIWRCRFANAFGRISLDIVEYRPSIVCDFFIFIFRFFLSVSLVSFVHLVRVIQLALPIGYS